MAAIDVHHDRVQQSVRLLELPADVAASLDSPAPPTLALKAADRGELVLCTPDKTFALKQVSSSNTLLLLGPHGSSSVSAFGHCAGLLEVLPLAREHPSALRLLSEALPVYDHEVEGHIESSSRETVFASIPYSDDELDAAWAELGAFDIDGHAARPAGSTRAAMWSALTTGAASASVDLAKPVQHASLSNYTSEFPDVMLEAQLHSISTVSDDRRVRLDRVKTVAAVASAVVAKNAGQASMPAVDEYVSEWKSMLPEAWRDDANVEAMEARDDYKESRARGSASASADEEGTAAKRRAGRAPNWHDKFKKTRTVR